MNINPFAHIDTTNFSHHKLGQRFKDAWKAIAGDSPFSKFAQGYQLGQQIALEKKDAEDKKNINANGVADANNAQADAASTAKEKKPSVLKRYLDIAIDFSVVDWLTTVPLSLIFLLPSVAVGLGLGIAALPGIVFLVVASDLDNNSPVAKAILYTIGGILVAPAAIAALAVVIAAAALTISMMIAKYAIAAALMAVSVLPILATDAFCNIYNFFAGGPAPAPASANETTQLLDKPTDSVVGGALGHTPDNKVTLLAGVDPWAQGADVKLLGTGTTPSQAASVAPGDDAESSLKPF